MDLPALFLRLPNGQNNQTLRSTDMQYQMKASLFKGEWVVEAINEEGDGEIYIAAFSGPEAKERAVEYAAWMKSSVRGGCHS